MLTYLIVFQLIKHNLDEKLFNELLDHNQVVRASRDRLNGALGRRDKKLINGPAQTVTEVMAQPATPVGPQATDGPPPKRAKLNATIVIPNAEDRKTMFQALLSIFRGGK
jgi:hypothetical protein